MMRAIDFRLTVLLVVFGCALQHANCSFSSQNQHCSAADGKHGTCQLAADCKSLSLSTSFDSFKTDRSFHLSEYLKVSRGDCGISQSDKSSPLYCCEVQKDNFDCNDAKNKRGTCKLIKDCPHANEIYKRCDRKSRCKNLLKDDMKFLYDSVKSCDAATRSHRNKKAHICCSENSMSVETATANTINPVTYEVATDEPQTVESTTLIKDLSCSLNELGQSGSCKRVDKCPIISEIYGRCDKSSRCSNLPEPEKNLLSSSIKACKNFNFKGDGGNTVYHACCGNFTIESAKSDSEQEETEESDSSENSSPPPEAPITDPSPTDRDPTPPELPVKATPKPPSVTEQKILKLIALHKKLLPADCGKTPYDFVDKIWDGEDTKMSEHPWLVALLYKDRENNNKLKVECGGSMITKRYVLTAAHCLEPKKPDIVRIGEWQISTEEDCAYNSEGEKVCNPRHVDSGVSKIITHQDYIKTGNMLNNDIGLIRTSKIIKFNSDQNNKKLPLVMPICLPPIDDQITNEIAIPDETMNFEVVGWGKTENNVMSDIKQSLELKGFNLQNCSSLYKLNLLDSQLCAGGVKGQDSCQGDSGGPLLREPSDADVPYYQDGIVSVGRKCGTEGMPGIYTRVSSFMEWILDTIETHQ